MSHPPPTSHRMGDKKRYYYSNNPNSAVRHGHSVFGKKSYSGLGGGNVSSGEPVVPGSNMTASMSAAQQSRYNPSSPKRAPSAARSRYNPEVEVPQPRVASLGSNAGIPARALPAHVGPGTASGASSSSSIDAGSTSAGGSRYSGSRYNPAQVQTSDIRVLTNNMTQPGNVSTVKEPFAHYSSMNRQTRPRSMEAFTKDPGYHYQNVNTGQGTLQNNPHLNPSSATGYYSRSNKWRSTSGSSTKLDYDNYHSGIAQPARPSFWKSQAPVNKFGGENRRFSSSTESQIPTTLNAAARYDGSAANINHNSNSSKESSLELNSEDKDGTGLTNSNVHSLGSSLINSVPQTTRKIEEEHYIGYQKFDLDKNASTDHTKLTKESENNQDSSRIKNSVPDTSRKIDVREEKNNKPSPKVTTAKEYGMWHTFQSPSTTSDNVQKPAIEEEREENLVFHEKSNWCYNDYEFLHDAVVLKTDIKNLDINPPTAGYSTPLKPIEKCIFPMTEKQTRLWELKNQKREVIISHQKYLLKTPIETLRSYPFMKRNFLVYKQATRPVLLRSISKLKKYELIRKLQLKKEFISLDSDWKRKCSKMDEISNSLRVEEIRKKKGDEEKDLQVGKADENHGSKERKTSGSSRRRNRADFVDDAEIENVLLQIDPDYKHHQLAADIPPMIINPVEKFAKKFKDVNNLVTDKQSWALRILKDGVDTFTEHEHELFIEGYLTFPKRFGKISNYMGGVRTPEECVLHYYRTKSSAGYKRMLIDKNKRRQKGAVAKRRKKKERSADTDNDTSLNVDTESVQEDQVTLQSQINEVDQGPKAVQTHEESLDVSTKRGAVPEIIDSEHINSKGSENVAQQQMEQVEIKLPQQDSQNIIENKKQNKSLPSNEENDEGVDQQITEDARRTDSDKESIHYDDSKDFIVSDIGISNERPHEFIADHLDSQHSIERGDSLSSKAENSTNSFLTDSKRLSVTEPLDMDPEKFDLQSDEINSQRKKQKQSGEHKSSYWSVKEANLFPELLKAYGSQWSLISEKLGTKSTTMVRNYYQRNAAQLGWKSVVEEADFKRNVTSSGSVQQSQILIQAEQASMGTMYCGVPPQQRPALGFFSNSSSSSKERSSSHVLSDSTPQPFAPETNKEFFPQPASPVSTLPPPRLPSIHLPSAGSLSAATNHATSQPQILETPSSNFHEIYSATSSSSPNVLPKIDRPPAIKSSSDNLLPKMEKPKGTTSSLMTILNEDVEQSFLPRINPIDQETSAVTAKSRAMPQNRNNAVVPESQTTNFHPSNGRPASLSLLLNPENEKPHQSSFGNLPSSSPAIPQKQSNVRSDHSLPVSAYPQPSVRQSQDNHQYNSKIATPSGPANINFAMDPLGALAAIASESLMPPKNPQKGSDGTNANET